MPIRVRCESCGKAMIVDDELAGRKGRCPNCKETIRIPDPAGRAGGAEPEGTGASALKPAGGKSADSAALAGVDFSKPLPPLEWIVEGPAGQQCGPVDLGTVQRWVLEGKVSATAKVQGPTTQGPRELRRVAEFQETLVKLQASRAGGPAHTIGTARIGKEEQTRKGRR